MSDTDPAVWEEAMRVLQEVADSGNCPLCGADLKGVCFSCGGSIPEGANYCPGCGASVAPPAERCPNCGARVSDATSCPQCGTDC